MNTYTILFTVHVTAAALSISFFVVRGVWMVLESPLLQRRAVRILPHVIDTILLAAAIGLTVVIGQYPFVNGWLTAKLLALIAYIALGMFALRRGKTKRQRVLALVAAVVVFGYIVSVAIAHSPWGVMAR